MTKRLRLALVMPDVTQGGGVASVARFLRNVALRQDELDLSMVSLSVAADDALSLRVAVPRSWSRGPIFEASVWDGVPLVRVGAMAAEFEFQRYRPRAALTRILADCDLVQVVSGSPAWANAVLGLNKPVSLHVATRARIERRQRDGHARTPADWWRRAMTEITDRMDDRALRRVDSIQVMNPWLLEYAQSLNQDRQVDIQCLAPGIDATWFRPLDRRPPTADAYILCVARFGDPRKRADLLLEAYVLLPEALRDRVRLVLAGSTPPPDVFWQSANSRGLRERITYVQRPDADALLGLYQRASVFALSSDEEGFGLVLLEAMACGVPVVSTRSGGPDAIVTDGSDGYLVPRDDASQLSRRLAQLLQDVVLNIDMGNQARRTIEQRYDERIVGERFVAIWRQMARAAGSVSP